jgi:hypothetical protein
VRKNELIKKLQELKGNPEIMIWNGIVEDFVNIGEIGIHSLVKPTRKDWINRVRYEEILYNEGFTDERTLIADYNKIPYEQNEYVTDEDIKQGYYKKKNIGYISSKKANKTSTSRSFNIDY